MIVSTQITNTDIFAFIAAPVLKLLSRKVSFIKVACVVDIKLFFYGLILL